MFRNLPQDLQRVVCLYLDDGEISKTGINFPDDDVFWTLRVQSITHVSTTSRKMYYEAIKELNSCYPRDYLKFGLYKKYLSGSFWSKDLALEMMEDEIFLTRHVNCQDNNGYSLLTYLCGNDIPNREALIKKLLSYGARDQYALTYYCQNTYDGPEDHPIIRLLVQYVTDINYSSECELNILFHAKCPSVVKVLLELGADPLQINANHMTAYDYANFYHRHDICKVYEEYSSSIRN